MNVSRLYTVLARDVGFNHTLHVGRVITPTVALVCQRDREIAGFTPSPYWTLGVNVSVQNGQFSAQWIPPKDPPEVARLMEQINLAEAPRSDAKFYEPCCGTGINTIHWLERILETRGAARIESAHLHLEDVDRLMVKGCMLQLFHYFDSRGVSPASMNIVALNTITRKPMGVAYYATAMPVEREQPSS